VSGLERLRYKLRRREIVDYAARCERSAAFLSNQLTLDSTVKRLELPTARKYPS
jgi:hypothetical protein